MAADDAAFGERLAKHAARARVEAGPPKAGDDRPVRWREFLEQGLFMRNVLREFLERQLAERDLKIESLEHEVAKLSKTSSECLRYFGPFNRTTCYQRGSIVTHGGVLWFCAKGTVGGPNPGNSESWVLMTKHAAAPKSTEGNKHGASQLTGKL
jgi:hypothetical protein